MQEISFPKPQLHIFVCINDRSNRVNSLPSCGPLITSDLVKELKHWIQANGLTTRVYATKAKCLGFCTPKGGVACVYPSGKFFTEIQNLDDLKKIVLDELDD